MKKYFLFFASLVVTLFLVHLSFAAPTQCVNSYVPACNKYSNEWTCLQDNYCRWHNNEIANDANNPGTGGTTQIQTDTLGYCENIPCSVDCCDFCNRYNASVCNKCLAGYQLVSGRCEQESLIITNCSDPYCSRCLIDECVECKANHTLVGGTCICSVPYCLDCNVAGVCTSCVTGYHLAEGKCEPDQNNSLAHTASITALMQIQDECLDQ